MDQNLGTKKSSSIDVECSNISDKRSSLNIATLDRETNGISPIVNKPVSNFAKDGTPIHTIAENNSEKKPSYLNLACCVNGYSNLTTYDSKIRQDINKSREVSPIRPSSNSIPYCKKSYSITPPKLLTSLDVVDKSDFSNYYNFAERNNSNRIMIDRKASEHENSGVSFIQQRVERLYGPGALAQGFYSPRKSKCNLVRELNDGTCKETSELSKKFKELIPNKCNFESNMKIGHNSKCVPRQITTPEICRQNINVDDLPVMRHLSQEFRSQLPVISPKKQLLLTNDFTKNKIPIAEVIPNQTNGRYAKEQMIAESNIPEKNTETSDKDGYYFLNALKKEQSRLLLLADKAEKFLDILLETPDVSEEVIGILRSASGKARLLVSQKLKQFEGLCHKNINCSTEDDFPTTMDDLQGFWDMVYLQIDHINVLFAEIEAIQNNGWKVCDNVPEPVKVQHYTPNKTNIKKIKSGDIGGSTKNVSESALKRESQRKLLQEIKRKQRLAMAANNYENSSDELVSKNENSMIIVVKDSNTIDNL